MTTPQVPTLESPVAPSATGNLASDSVATVAVPMYREPLSGKSFPTEAQAVRHGLRMQKVVRGTELKKARQDLWLTVESSDSFLTCLKESVRLLIEEWEVRFERKKSAVVPPEWKSGRIVEWSLGSHGMLNVYAEFEVWHDTHMYKKEILNISLDGLTGFSSSERSDNNRGDWKFFRGNRFQAEAGSRGTVGKTGLEYYQCSLIVALPIKSYPALHARVKAELELLSNERMRRDQISWQVEDAQEADAELTASKKALAEAEARVRLLRGEVAHQEQAIEGTIRGSAEAKEGLETWTKSIANTIIGAEKLEKLAHSGYQWDVEGGL